MAVRGKVTEWISRPRKWRRFKLRNVPVAVTNRKEKLLRFGSLATASLRLQRAFVSFSGAGSLFPQR